MPGEKRRRKDSRQTQVVDSAQDRGSAKKRRKDKSGTEKRKRKHDGTGLEEATEKGGTDVNELDNVAKIDGKQRVKEGGNDDDVKGELKKRKKKRSKSKSNTEAQSAEIESPKRPSQESISDKRTRKLTEKVTEQKPGTSDREMEGGSSKDNPIEKRESTRKKRKRERQSSKALDKDFDIKPNDSVEELCENKQKVDLSTRDHEQTDGSNPGSAKKSSVGHGLSSSSPKSPALRQPTAAPGVPSKKPTETISAGPSDQLEDDEKPLDNDRLPRTLFVGNVPLTATRKQLRQMFSEYAPIESVRIRNVIPVNPKIPKKVALLKNRLASFSNSFSAYVVFKEATNIEQVLQRAVDGTNMTIFQKHHLRVTKALQTKGKVRQSVFVGNLPFGCTDEDLITAFMPVAKECGVRLMNVRVNRDSDTGVCRGVGFVTFDDIMGVQACLNKTGDIKIGGRAVRMERAFKTKNMKSKSYKRKRKAAFGHSES